MYYNENMSLQVQVFDKYQDSYELELKYEIFWTFVQIGAIIDLMLTK